MEHFLFFFQKFPFQIQLQTILWMGGSPSSLVAWFTTLIYGPNPNLSLHSPKWLPKLKFRVKIINRLTSQCYLFILIRIFYIINSESNFTECPVEQNWEFDSPL